MPPLLLRFADTATLPQCFPARRAIPRTGEIPAQACNFAPESGDGVHLALLDAAAGFEALMIRFDDPATAIPLDPLPGQFTRRCVQLGHYDPFKRLVICSRIGLPDPYHPDR